jgi:hypothetical protein
MVDESIHFCKGGKTDTLALPVCRVLEDEAFAINHRASLPHHLPRHVVYIKILIN